MFDRIFLIDTYKNKSFNGYIDEINLHRSKYFSVAIMLIELGMLIFSFLNPDFYKPEQLLDYRFLYGVLFVSSTLYIVYVYFESKQLVDFKKYYVYLTYFLIIVGIFWGAAISVLDMANGNAMYVYMTFVFLVAVVILSKPVLFAVILLVMQAYFLGAIEKITLSILLNSSFFLVFAWLVNRMNYASEYDKYRKNELIEEKNKLMEKQNDELIRLSQTDYLTGLYNRYSMDSILSKKYFEAYIHQEEFTVLMIDVNEFKKFNDTFGHVRGDDCLKKVSKILMGVANENEGFAFRYGGDEFCLIFSNIKQTTRILNLINDRMKSIYEDIEISLSIGQYSLVPQNKNNEWETIERADQALYLEKSKKRRRKED